MGGWLTGYMQTFEGEDHYGNQIVYTEPIVYCHVPNEADIEMLLERVADYEHIPCADLSKRYQITNRRIQVTWLDADIKE